MAVPRAGPEPNARSRGERRRRPRIFLGLRETSGYYWHLHSGFRELGIYSTYADLSGNPNRYDARTGSWWTGMARTIANGRRNSGSHVSTAAWRAAQLVLSAGVLAWALPRHDVFVFGSPQASLVRVTYPLLRRLGKTVISVLHGSDSRPPYLNAKYAGEVGSPDVQRLTDMTLRLRGDLKRIEQWSSVVISHPPSSQFLTRDFIDFLTVGIPFPAPPEVDGVRSGPVRVLHAPSHAGAKGTGFIREAIASQAAAGVNIEYVEVSGRANQEVLRVLSTVDVAVDQAFSDQPMASFATEASAHGVPVVVGSCDWDGALRNTEDPPPTVRCAPDEIGEFVARLAVDPGWRKRAGTAARAYVVGRLAPTDVAARYLAVIEGNVPAEWRRSPDDITYASGIGLNCERVQVVVSAIVSAYGEEALQLSDRPLVRNQLLRSVSRSQ